MRAQGRRVRALSCLFYCMYVRIFSEMFEELRAYCAREEGFLFEKWGMSMCELYGRWWWEGKSEVHCSAASVFLPQRSFRNIPASISSDMKSPAFSPPSRLKP